MTDREKEIIVQSIVSGKNTYQDLQSVLPHIHNWNVLGFPERMSPDDVLKIDVQMSYADALLYQVKATDTFHLTEAGLDFLDKLHKEEAKMQKQDESIKWAKYATLAGSVGAIATIISILLSA